MKRRPARLLQLLLGLLLLVGGGALQAQERPGADAPLTVVDDAERQALERIVRTPPPDGTDRDRLRQHHGRVVDAARRLGDPAVRERTLREAMAALPEDSRWPNDLAWMAFDTDRRSEALTLFEAAIARTRDPIDRLLYESNRLMVLAARGDAEVPAAVARLRPAAEAELAARSVATERSRLLRVLGALANREAEWHERLAQPGEALAARAEAERRYREAHALLDTPALKTTAIAGYARASLAIAQRDRALALLRLARYAEAEALLAEHMAFIRAQSLPADFSAAAHHVLATLRLWRGEFAEAERQLRLARKALDSLRYARTHPSQIGKTRDLVLVLWARGEIDAARLELEALDAEVVRSKRGADRARMRFERGLVELASGRPAEAAPLFEVLARQRRDVLGPGHYLTASVRGLHGVALWRQGERERGGELLREAVLDMLSPRNGDYLDDANVRRQVRTLVFTTYLEAMAERGGLQALAALGVADHLLAGSTAQAMADAALRSLSADPQLAGLVREEQDLRQQLQALQQPAAGDDGARIDDGARKRIAELELKRQQVQERLRARVPGYDRLLRPPLPDPTGVAQRLRRDEVLLLAMPTGRELYLWLLSADELPQFKRVAVGAAALDGLVDRLRRGLDFALNGGRTGRFDDAAAHELYRHVVAPVAAGLKGKRHLIVATSGALARVPLSLLLTAPPTADARPWLVRQLAISQVPNIAAWLALRQMPPAQPAPEPLLAWADPVYGRLTLRPARAPVRRGVGAADEEAAAEPASGSRAAPRPGGKATSFELPPLPETRDEVRAIATALKADPARDLVLGAEATRESVLAFNRSGRLGRQRVLVFALHGLMAGDLPGLQQPALAMSIPGTVRDVGAVVLGLDDVLGLKLNADWVVLSACNTASADGRGEEALTGLARGFLYAGTRSLLVTHWAVETESAKLLTTATFEHHMSQRDAGRAESLRQAMLKLMASPRYTHPAYWAPYVLVGDGGR